MSKAHQGRIFIGVVVAVILLCCSEATFAAEEPAASAPQSWVTEATSSTLLYGSIYLSVVTAVQAARLVLTAVTPVEWLGLAQALGVPAVVVPIMVQLVPTVKQWVPQAAAHITPHLVYERD